MTTVAQQRLEQRFSMWDRDGDGDVDRADWESEARRILKAFGEPEGSQKGSAVLSAYLGMWERLAALAGVGSDGSFTAEQFAAVVQEHMLDAGDAGFDEMLRPTISAIVGLCDTDGDNQVNPSEFKNWLKAIGVDDSQADDAFRQIDTSGNGQLSVDELIDAVRAFHAGESDVSLLG